MLRDFSQVNSLDLTRQPVVFEPFRVLFGMLAMVAVRTKNLAVGNPVSPATNNRFDVVQMELVFARCRDRLRTAWNFAFVALGLPHFTDFFRGMTAFGVQNSKPAIAVIRQIVFSVLFIVFFSLYLVLIRQPSLFLLSNSFFLVLLVGFIGRLVGCFSKTFRISLFSDLNASGVLLFMLSIILFFIFIEPFWVSLPISQIHGQFLLRISVVASFALLQFPFFVFQIILAPVCLSQSRCVCNALLFCHASGCGSRSTDCHFSLASGSAPRAQETRAPQILSGNRDTASGSFFGLFSCLNCTTNRHDFVRLFTAINFKFKKVQVNY